MDPQPNKRIKDIPQELMVQILHELADAGVMTLYRAEVDTQNPDSGSYELSMYGSVIDYGSLYWFLHHYCKEHHRNNDS